MKLSAIDRALEEGSMRARTFTGGESWQRARSGLYLPPTTTARDRYGPWPIGIDLFSGCGGFSLGFIQAGWRIVAAVEHEEWAALTYMWNLGTYPMDIHYVSPADKERLEKVLRREMKRRARRGLEPMPLAGSGWISSTSGDTKPEWFEETSEPFRRVNNMGIPGVPHFWFGDIRKVTGAEILAALQLQPGDVDCVMGGPPCQGFSTAGKRDVMDPRNSLVFDFVRLVLDIMPKTMIMENVPALLSMTTPEGVPVVDALCNLLQEGGFGHYDALKKSLLSTAGMGGAVKTNRESRKEQKAAKKNRNPQEPAQADLFDGIAV